MAASLLVPEGISQDVSLSDAQDSDRGYPQ